MIKLNNSKLLFTAKSQFRVPVLHLTYLVTVKYLVKWIHH